MAIDERGKATARMHLYMQTMVEAVNPSSGHLSKLLFARIGIWGVHYKTGQAADILSMECPKELKSVPDRE